MLSIQEQKLELAPTVGDQYLKRLYQKTIHFKRKKEFPPWRQAKP